MTKEQFDEFGTGEYSNADLDALERFVTHYNLVKEYRNVQIPSEKIIYNPIDEEQNPLDYVEIERPETQENALGAPDEVGVPVYTPKDSSEINTSMSTDESGIPNPLDFMEGTGPVFTSFLWPTDNTGWIGSGFQEYEGHTGMDIIVSVDTPIYASADGIVVAAKNTNVGYGKYIVIDHGGGYQTLYAHCSKLNVSVGDEVKAGQIIAATGRSGNTTGYQLHFEIRKNGEPMNPKDYVNVDNSPMELPQ